MQLIKDTNGDLVKHLAGSPAARDRLPGLRRGHDDVSLLHQRSLLREAKSWIDQDDLKTKLFHQSALPVGVDCLTCKVARRYIEDLAAVL